MSIGAEIIVSPVASLHRPIALLHHIWPLAGLGAPLKEVLDRTDKRSTVILTNNYGFPWTSDGFRTSWGKLRPRPALSRPRSEARGERGKEAGAERKAHEFYKALAKCVEPRRFQTR